MMMYKTVPLDRAASCIDTLLCVASIWQRIGNPGPRGGQPRPLKSLIRPHRPPGQLPGASQVLLCRTSCKDFRKKSVQMGRGNPGRIQILPHSGRPGAAQAASCFILALHPEHPGTFWPTLCGSQNGSSKLPQNDLQKTSKIIPKKAEYMFFSDLSSTCFSTTSGSY